ncbi:TPA-induced transmembrane protein isoform X2 [Ursus arctos]|uniref:TPA-induced transmembrane protein isoform X2 n=1 Tax=Ursus arctos TaxID=9644 RepID=UPI002548D892|nr:TPA-induced transmembrane protein isoform X2 [Ursus arctos]
MEEARSPSPGEDLELLALGGQPDEQKPLNGTVQVIPLSVEEPCPAQANKENPWSSCNKKLVGKCKLWMVIASVFLGLVVVIIVSLCLIGVTYIDEDANEILELSSNKTFLVMLKIPEECITEKELPHLLTERNEGEAVGLHLKRSTEFGDERIHFVFQRRSFKLPWKAWRCPKGRRWSFCS